MDASSLPSFKDLPAVDGMPHGCAWGLFDGADGQRDQLGTLNLLTPATVVAAARSEIRTGLSVAVDWPLNKPAKPLFGRCAFEHRVIDLKPALGHAVHDDEVRLNTQAGSQWDGFKHFAHQASEKYYNGQTHAEVATSSDNGIDHWAQRGGIVGRGVLLDYVRWARKQNISYHAMQRHAIGVDALDAMARDQGVELRAGDILIVRSGFTQWYEGASEQERDEVLAREQQEWAGVEGSLKTVEWLWDHHFAAVAGDCISWEQWPFNEEVAIHEYQLAFWGSPIGELWDLERLAKVCEEQKRWSFFFTSAPLNVPGGVASPPNGLCIF